MPDKEVPKEEAPQIQMLMTIGLTPDGKLIIQGNLKEKAKCLTYLAEAIKIVANFDAKPSKIIQPNVVVRPHRVMNFIRRKR